MYIYIEININEVPSYITTLHSYLPKIQLCKLHPHKRGVDPSLRGPALKRAVPALNCSAADIMATRGRGRARGWGERASERERIPKQ